MAQVIGRVTSMTTTPGAAASPTSLHQQPLDRRAQRGPCTCRTHSVSKTPVCRLPARLSHPFRLQDPWMPPGPHVCHTHSVSKTPVCRAGRLEGTQPDSTCRREHPGASQLPRDPPVCRLVTAGGRSSELVWRAPVLRGASSLGTVSARVCISCSHHSGARQCRSSSLASAVMAGPKKRQARRSGGTPQRHVRGGRRLLTTRTTSSTSSDTSRMTLLRLSRVAMPCSLGPLRSASRRQRF